MKKYKWMPAVIFLLIATINAAGQNEQQNKQKEKVETTQLLNTDKEPKIKGRKFVSLFNGSDLQGWTTQQGTMKFEVMDGVIVGTCSEGPSTFLCTEKEYVDFIFTCETKWIVDGNSGVQIR